VAAIASTGSAGRRDTACAKPGRPIASGVRSIAAASRQAAYSGSPCQGMRQAAWPSSNQAAHHFEISATAARDQRLPVAASSTSATVATLAAAAGEGSASARSSSSGEIGAGEIGDAARSTAAARSSRPKRPASNSAR
jgi:hypothetical protein